MNENNKIDSIASSELQCAICLDILYVPYEHQSCGNMFCYDCVNKLQECPLCRKSLIYPSKCGGLKLVTVRVILSAISEFHRKCEICGKKVIKADEKTHKEEDCMMSCPHCSQMVEIKKYSEHVDNNCYMRCKTCNKKVRTIKYQYHLDAKCTRSCRYCYQSMLAKHYTNHCENECHARIVICPAAKDGCSWKGEFNSLLLHIENCDINKCVIKYESIIQGLKDQIRELSEKI